MENLHEFRKSYTKFQLDETDVNKNPLKQFNIWLKDAIEDGSFEANAMIVSTINKNLQPSSRVVLLKQLVEEGFIFFTNYDSRKGQDIQTHKNASILFFWEKFERQVRIEGKIEKVPDSISDDYFFSRPKQSQIGAIVLKQTKVLKDRKTLENEIQSFDENKEIKRPENWGGYILKPHYFEFWQGRANRLHDRIVFEKEKNNWIIKRIYP